jgi:hypothetical protein
MLFFIVEIYVFTNHSLLKLVKYDFVFATCITLGHGNIKNLII